MEGITLRLPGEFFAEDEFDPDPIGFLEDYRVVARAVRPVPVGHHHKVRAFKHKGLDACSHVFLRTDAVRKPLENPYRGPFRVIKRTSDRVYRLDVEGRETEVSVERLKPAHMTTHMEDTTQSSVSHFTTNADATVTNRTVKTYPGKKRVSFNVPDTA